MTERAIEITTEDGVVDGYIYEDVSVKPGILFYTDIRGVRTANRNMASRLAEEGYTVLLPNVFYRTGRPPVMDPDAEGEALMKRFGELRAPLTPTALNADAGAYIDFLLEQNSVADGPIGAVGYCFTGGFALRTAALRPDIVAAAASFHGGGLYSDEPSSPHLVLPEVKGRLYFGHAFEDRSMPADAIEKFDEALSAWGGSYESDVYANAQHGWTVPDSKAYNEPEAEKAYGKLTGLFNSVL